MGSFRRAARIAPALCLIFLSVVSSFASAIAQTTTFLSGTVTADGRPVKGANVTAVGSNVALHTSTDAQGRFTFTAVPIGTYDVDANATEGSASLRVDVPTAGATVTVGLSGITVIGRTSVAARPPLGGSGTDLTLSSELLMHSPANGSLPGLLLQLPGAARGANGVVHLNGDHGDVNYIVDGVPIPQELNRNIGTEFDPNDLAFVEAIEGAYPAQYGERFASVIDANTRSGAGAPGFTAQLNAGSFTNLDADLAYHTPIGLGSLVVATRNEQGTRGLDPPNPNSPHNDFSNANQFLRYTQPIGSDFLNLTLSHAYQTYQIPNDVAGGEPASTDDNETQNDFFGTLQYRHPLGDHGSLTFGPTYKRSQIRDLGDPDNDLVFGGLSLFGDRTAIDTGAVFDYDNHSNRHDVRFGGVYDATTVAKTYAVTPAAGPTVVDNAPNVGHLAAFYLQDSWKISNFQIDYGLRTDTFLESSTQFAVGFAAVSPRIKLTYNLTSRASVYAFYGRYFTPFSLENVSPSAAFALNVPLQTSLAQFDLKPERDSAYEIGGHFGVGKGDLGIRVMQKNATDSIDDTQVGVTNLHQDINYAQGRIATQSAYYQLGFGQGSRFYASMTHTYSVNKGCETQLLAPCFGQPDDWTPADHDQRIDVAAGIIANDRRGGWFALDGEYGSGLSTGLNPNGGITCAGPGYVSNIGGPCKFTPHVTFDAEKGIALVPGLVMTLRIQNLLDDRYLVTFLNAQGNHYAPPRTLEVGLRLSGK